MEENVLTWVDITGTRKYNYAYNRYQDKGSQYDSGKVTDRHTQKNIISLQAYYINQYKIGHFLYLRMALSTP